MSVLPTRVFVYDPTSSASFAIVSTIAEVDGGGQVGVEYFVGGGVRVSGYVRLHKDAPYPSTVFAASEFEEAHVDDERLDRMIADATEAVRANQRL